MIRFSLRCDNKHSFDSWFKSNDAYESLNKAGMLSCPICGSPGVKKSMMTPRVSAASDSEPEIAQSERKPDLSGPATPAEQAFAELKQFIVKNSEYVGTGFAREARAIHEGDSPKRSIYGEAKPEDARALVKEGIPVAPLPWISERNSN